MDHCVSLAEQLRRARARGRLAFACFYDLSRAFDSVWHAKVIERLHKIGASPEIFGFVSSFLTDRSFQVRWGSSYSTPGRTDMGVPQGSVISPLLFVLLLKDPGEALEGSAMISSHADDICLFRNAHSKRGRKIRWHTVKKDLASFQRDSDAVVAYLEDLGFRVNDKKTVFMVFNCTLHADLKLRVGDTVLTPQRQVIYLGVVYTYNLNWAPYMEKLVAAARGAGALVRSASREPWGKERGTLVSLVMSLVRSRLVYGMEAARDMPSTYINRLMSVIA